MLYQLDNRLCNESLLPDILLSDFKFRLLELQELLPTLPKITGSGVFKMAAVVAEVQRDFNSNTHIVWDTATNYDYIRYYFTWAEMVNLRWWTQYRSTKNSFPIQISDENSMALIHIFEETIYIVR